ncbi:MAG: HEPN domain-containing protein [Methanocellales archaeon]|nr:HEPN domain-containing protein [Methanocellales archaeon]MDD3291851.1 HEPN domain-containing protein [Methanocellales archaeon]MDD5235494.1 HEPN domain-containing protein [Methanocellales archaeon]MDD5485113.1 HEPN domain-containing protein [Methanocellales archaeon]
MRYEKISKAFLIEAKDDIEMAEIAYSHGKFSKAVYHSQQCVEKAFKAALVLKGKFISEHEVLTDFLKVYQNELSRETIEKIMKDTPKLESQFKRVRYPLFGRTDLPIWIPSKEYDESDAKSAIEKANLIFGILSKYLEGKHRSSK